MNDAKLVLDAIGNTPLVELQNIVPQGSARVIAKLESTNPTGSMKDRMARALGYFTHFVFCDAFSEEKRRAHYGCSEREQAHHRTAHQANDRDRGKVERPARSLVGPIS